MQYRFSASFGTLSSFQCRQLAQESIPHSPCEAEKKEKCPNSDHNNTNIITNTHFFNSEQKISFLTNRWDKTEKTIKCPPLKKKNLTNECFTPILGLSIRYHMTAFSAHGGILPWRKEFLLKQSLEIM